MAISLPNGAQVAMATGYAAAKTITSITNASPAVVSSTAHAYVTGDIIEVTSGWSRLTDKVVKVTQLTVDTFSLSGVDATSTLYYPAGGGAGSSRKISGWTQLTQVLESSSSGGEQQFLEYQLLEGDIQKRIPTVKSASGLTFSVADDPTLAGHILASAANDDRLPRAIRITLPSGATIFYNAYVSMSKTPTLSVNQIMAVEITLSMLAEPVRYTT